VGKPTPETFIRAQGRNGTVIWSANWTQTDSDNYITPEPLLSLTDLSGNYSDGGSQQHKARFSIKKVSWIGSEFVTGTIYFDSMPPGPDSNVLVIPPGATSGERDFSGFPSGSLNDPVPAAPGNLALITEDALPNERLEITIWFRENGKRFKIG
jgi:hypothetical protein